MALSQSHTTTTTTTTTATTTHSTPVPLISPILGSAGLKHRQPALSSSASTPSASPVKESTTGRSAPSLPDTAKNNTESPAKETSRHESLNYRRRQSTPSTSSSKQSRPGLFTFAALTRDKTSTATASQSDPSIRSKPSSGSLYLSAQSSPTTPSFTGTTSARSTDTLLASSIEASPSQSRSQTQYSTSNQRQSLLGTNPPSQAYTDTAADTQPPIAFVPARRRYNNMHQTSSRLLRMTDDDRPYTRVSCAGRLEVLPDGLFG